ncbi:TPA: hypothetical protein SC633_001792 [Campylobacter fetus]|nr:hypothetical protein [Campylobacter fetus]
MNLMRKIKIVSMFSIEQKKGITTLWSTDLKRVVESNNLQKGEIVKFKIIGKQEYNINRKTIIDGKFETIQETLTKPIWSCDVLGREKI